MDKVYLAYVIRGRGEPILLGAYANADAANLAAKLRVVEEIEDITDDFPEAGRRLRAEKIFDRADGGQTWAMKGTRDASVLAWAEMHEIQDA